MESMGYYDYMETRLDDKEKSVHDLTLKQLERVSHPTNVDWDKVKELTDGLSSLLNKMSTTLEKIEVNTNPDTITLPTHSQTVIPPHDSITVDEDVNGRYSTDGTYVSLKILKYLFKDFMGLKDRDYYHLSYEDVVRGEEELEYMGWTYEYITFIMEQLEAKHHYTSPHYSRYGMDNSDLFELITASPLVRAKAISKVLEAEGVTNDK